MSTPKKIYDQKISPDDLICMNDHAEDAPIHIHLAYAADEKPNIFGQVYRPDARLYLHRDLAKIVLRAAHTIHDTYGLDLVLYDGLRTTTAQERMQNSPITTANLHWLEEPGRLLSPPGAGAHPRGMAIDLTLCDALGTLLDMGTVFDHLAEDPSPEHNPAHREYADLSADARHNRSVLSDEMMNAAQSTGHDLLPLPQEWWDFRFPAEIYNQYAPLSDDDLPDDMKMCESF
jgi:D-alanyl-D-alanine dipeptidase